MISYNNEISLIEEMQACCSSNTGTVTPSCTNKIFPDKIYKSVQPKGEDVTGMTCECGVFGAIACGDYPTQVSLVEMSHTTRDRAQGS